MKAAAFKEWDSVVRALGSGEQCIILRKGGIHEKNRIFEIRNRSFFLFPTFEHQELKDLNPRGQYWLSVSQASGKISGKIRLEYQAKLEEAWFTNSWASVDKLSDFHAASCEGIRKKFDWGDQPGLYVLLVRVYRLNPAFEIEDLPAYAGCRSWVDVEVPSAVLGVSQPVLKEDLFIQNRERLRGILTGCEIKTEDPV